MVKDMPQLTEKDIQSVLDERVRPILKSHNGGIDLIGIEEGDIVRLRLAGACAACMGAEQTIKDIIVAAVVEAFPSVDVRVETGVSDEMVSEALRFLKRAK